MATTVIPTHIYPTVTEETTKVVPDIEAVNIAESISAYILREVTAVP
jgi:hypothetical protein